MRFTSLIKRWPLFFCVLAVLMVQPAQLSAWGFSVSGVRQENFSQEISNIRVIPVILSADLNGDGKPECLEMYAERLQISDCHGKPLWQSPPEWQVKEAQIGDLNHDGKAEAILLVWRPFKPWPIDKFLPSGGRINTFHNQAGLSCQVILIGWSRGAYNEVWAGSALIQPVTQLHAVDLDGDGWQELVTLEGKYDQNENRGVLTIWKWNGFGFTLEDQTRQTFTHLLVVSSNQQIGMVVQK